MFHLQLFIEYFKQYMKVRLAYRWDFIVQIVTDFFYQAINLVFILVVFAHTKTLQGWTQHEVIFIYGYFLIPWEIFNAIFNLWHFNERYVINGEMDRILTRPVYSLLQVIMETMTPESLIGVITGAVIMGWAATGLEIEWAWYDPILLLVFALGGVAIYGGIYISLISISLFTDSKSDLQPIIYNIGTYGRYPVNIYHRIIQIFLTWVLPFAFVGFYPASYLLDKTQWMWYALITPLVGIVYLGIGIMIWNWGIRYYRGAGN